MDSSEVFRIFLLVLYEYFIKENTRIKSSYRFIRFISYTYFNDMSLFDLWLRLHKIKSTNFFAELIIVSFCYKATDGYNE